MSLTSDWSHTRSKILLATVVRHTTNSVDIDEDAGVTLLVRTRKLGCLARREGTGARHLDLRTACVELSLTLLVGAMQRKNLST